MAFEYEALAGYLYVVGGRAISMPPPGTLIEVAPRKAARGREADTFFTLIMPAFGALGEAVAPASFYEGLTRTAAQAYFNSTGSVTAGIKVALRRLNRELYERNQSEARRYEASALCAVLRGADLYVGRVGAGVAVFRKTDELAYFPTDFDYDEGLFGVPLGVQPEPDPRMGRYQVVPGARLVLSDALLADYEPDALQTALAAEDIGATLAALRDGTETQLTLMAVEFVPHEQVVPLPARVAESSAVLMGAAPAVADMPPPADTAATPEAASAPPANPIRRSAKRGSAVRGAIGRVSAFGARIVEILMHLLDRIIPPPQEGRRGWLGSPYAVGVTVLIPVVVVVLVVLFWLSGTGESAFDQCVNRALSAADTARTISFSDVRGTVAGWNAVLAIVDECDALRANDPAMNALRREARSNLDQLQNVERRTLTPLYPFPNAQLTDAVLQGEDMYLLDSNNQQVYRITLTEDGMNVVDNSYTPIPAMRRGGRVINFDVGDLVDIAWADVGSGLSQSNVIAALDRNGVVIACPPRFLQDCTAQQLPGSETWENPIAIQFWEGRLYILDPGANQIWRYDPTGGTFAGVPLEYFSGVGRPDITGAIDFAITTAGEVYLLLDTGVVARFRSGEQEDFAFSGFPESQTLSNPDAMFLNTNPIAQGLFITERSQRTIFETTMAGTFINAYRAEDEDLFAGLNNVLADSNNNVVYALSGNTLFAFPREVQE